MTVPMSRPSATRPGVWRKAQLQGEQGLPHRRQGRDFRGGIADFLGADGMADVFRAQEDVAAVEARRQVLGHLGDGVLVVQVGAAAQRRQRGQAVQGAGIEQVEAEVVGTRGGRAAVGDRALAGRGRTVDGDMTGIGWAELGMSE
jgi:hypothetical protein